MPVYPKARTFDIVREVFQAQRAVKQLRIQSPGPSRTDDAWHSFVYQNGYTDSGAGVAGQYRLVGQPANEIEIIGDLAVPAPSGVVIASLAQDANGVPTNYGVTSLQQLTFIVIGSTGTASVLTPRVFVSGTPATLTAINIPTGTTRGFFHGFVSIDA